MKLDMAVLCQDARGLGRDTQVEASLENAASREAARLASEDDTGGNVLKAGPQCTHEFPYM